MTGMGIRCGSFFSIIFYFSFYFISTILWYIADIAGFYAMCHFSGFAGDIYSLYGWALSAPTTEYHHHHHNMCSTPITPWINDRWLVAQVTRDLTHGVSNSLYVPLLCALENPVTQSTCRASYPGIQDGWGMDEITILTYL